VTARLWIMRCTYHMFLADTLSRIDEQIAHAQSFNIERGNDEMLLVVANVVSDLYDTKDKIESQLRFESEYRGLEAGNQPC
jgi:hypothetical protein